MTTLNARYLNTGYLNARYRVSRMLLAFVCLGCIAYAAAQPQEQTMLTIMQLTNNARAQARTCGDMSMAAAPPLRWNDVLAGLAAGHSQDMADRNFFEHTNPDGQTAHARIEASSYPSLSGSAENIAYRFDTNHALFLEDWLNSPGHCSNLMDPDLKDFGYGIARASNGRIYATQVFASSFGNVVTTPAPSTSESEVTTPEVQPAQPSENIAITALDIMAPGNYVNESLRAGFQPDSSNPLEFEVIAGGDIWAEDLNLEEGCLGYIANTPDATVEWLGGEGATLLTMYVVSDEDVTLLVNTPNGWVCSDDFSGTNPLVTMYSAVPGAYSVWIGTFGANAEATLYISEYEMAEGDF
ncbi:MAG: CAP domain-containing protein [Deinococcota bacterium]